MHRKPQTVGYTTLRACLCCAGGRLEPVYDGASLTVRTMTSVHGLRLRFDICRDCGFVMYNPRPEEGFYSAFYADQHRIDFALEGRQRIQRKADQYAFIARFVEDRARRTVFDIGAFDGGFLAFFKAAGWQVLGNELSPSACSAAEEVHGIDLFRGGFEAAPVDVPLDLVTIVHVLEHLAEPAPLLQRVHRCLAPDGLLFIEVPTLDTLDAANLSDFFDFQHLLYFDQETLPRFLGRCGFLVETLDLGGFNRSLRVVARRSDSPVIASAANTYDASRRRIARYAEARAGLVERIADRLGRVQGPVTLYGAGQHTEMLFKLLGRYEIRLDVRQICDSDPNKAGTTAWGLPVIAPAELEGCPDTVVISSFAFAGVIFETLRGLGIPAERIVDLYARPSARAG